MGRLLGYMANRAHRIADALHQEESAIATVATGQPDGWGIGFYQGGEVLHKKRPRGDGLELDWAEVTGDITTECAIAHVREATIGDFRADNTHPFRFRQWLFAHAGTVQQFETIRPQLIESFPDFLRLNIRGETDSECVFHAVLASLHERAQLDVADPDEATVIEALRSAVSLVDRLSGNDGPKSTLNLLLTNGRHMYAARRGQPLYFVERQGLDTLSSSDNRRVSGGVANPFRYILVLSDGSNGPPGYRLIEENQILSISRELDIATYSFE